MKKARIMLTVIALCIIINGLFAFKVSQRRGLSNLYLTTTATFTNNGVTRVLTYATLSPYRTFATNITQGTISVTRPLYTQVTLTITVIGGGAVTYTVATGFPWDSFFIYDDENQ